MNNSKQRFDIQIKKIKTLLENAKSQENPALWLYLNDLRTPLFMLEGLAKIYANLHNKKDFEKIKEQVKELEDALGAVDYYVAFEKEFASNEKIPANLKQHISSQSKEKILALGQLLQSENWLNNTRIAKIESRIKNANWLKEEKEVNKIKKYYASEIKETFDFVKDTKYVFDNIELDVHELRRKLRWLSIYPQALNGIAKLLPAKNNSKSIQKYLTKEIVNSPFNQLSPNKGLKHLLQFNKNNFLALSWMIAELGKIKDEGLRIKIIADALQATSYLKTDEAENQATLLLGENKLNLNSLLENASAITKTYFSEKLLSDLIK